MPGHHPWALRGVRQHTMFSSVFVVSFYSVGIVVRLAQSQPSPPKEKCNEAWEKVTPYDWVK